MKSYLSADGISLKEAAMNCTKVSIARFAAIELLLTVPAEMNATGSALHVHAPAVFLNARTTLRAPASVVRVFVDPLQHLGALFDAQRSGM